jgi:quercetin dioxygenase-like cupin family protein
MSSAYFVTPAEAAQVEQLKGLHRRTMAITDKMMVCEFFIERETVIPDHQHPHDHVGYVIYGKVEMKVGDEVRVCDPGDTYQIPGGVVHGAKALVDSLVIDIFSPPREDYRVASKQGA